MDPILEEYQNLAQRVQSYNPGVDLARMERAFRYADAQHAGQLRKSGEPYIIHPLHVAEIVAELGMDMDSIIAALLHDCIEDTGSTHEDIAKLFGATVGPKRLAMSAWEASVSSMQSWSRAATTESMSSPSSSTSSATAMGWMI